MISDLDKLGLTLAEVVETGPNASATKSVQHSAGSAAAPLFVTDEWVWAPDGDGYSVAGLGERGHLADLKGLAMIKELVRSPGQPIPMAFLVGCIHDDARKDKRSSSRSWTWKR